MIESDIAVGAGLRITCSKDELVQGLTLVGRAVSSRTAIQILSGILLEAQGDELRLAATDMELSLRAAVPARVEGDGAVVLPGRTLVDIARLLPGDDVTIEHRAAESVVHVELGQRELHAPHVQRGGLPAAAGAHRDGDVLGRPRGAARDDRPRRARGLARRGAPRAHRRPRPVRRRQARHGGDRLVPARREGDVARLACSRARGDRPQPRAAGALAHPRRRRRDRGRRAGEPGALLDRRRLAHDAPDRRPVPELPAAPARGVRARADDLARRAARCRAARCGDDPARDAAAAALRRRRGHGRRADARGRRVEGVDAGRLQRRAARDRLQRGVPEGGARVDRGRRREDEADQPASPGDPHRRGRRLHVPRHADPPSRADRRDRLAPRLSLLRAARAGTAAGARARWSARTAWARRTCSRRCTSRLRGSRRGRAPTRRSCGSGPRVREPRSRAGAARSGWSSR